MSKAIEELLQNLEKERSSYATTSATAPDQNVQRMAAGIAEGLRIAIVHVKKADIKM